MEEKRIATSEKLALALEEECAPAWMVRHARSKYYDDFESAWGNPFDRLIVDLRRCGLHNLARRVLDAEFEGQKWESDEWAASPEGLAAIHQFGLD